MALNITLAKRQEEAKENFTIIDTTGSYDALTNTGGYGGPNEDRTDVANYLLVSKNNTNGARTYLEVVNTDPLNTMEWSLVSEVDGWYQATLLSFQKWNGSDSYVSSGDPDVVYYTGTSKFYMAIQNSTNIAPDSGSGSQYWAEITDFTEIQQDYSNVVVVDYEFLIDSRTSLCIADALHEAISDDFLCKLTLEEASHPLNMIASLEGAYAKMANDEGSSAEQIIVAISDCCE
jgi:hypothetical protein